MAPTERAGRKGHNANPGSAVERLIDCLLEPASRARRWRAEFDDSVRQRGATILSSSAVSYTHLTLPTIYSV